jgi:hypothetical protein
VILGAGDSLLSTLASIAVVSISAFWAVMRLIKHRVMLPKAELTHKIEWRPINSDWQLVRLTLIIKNKAEMLLKLQECSVEIKDFETVGNPDLIARGESQRRLSYEGDGYLIGDVHGLEWTWPPLRKAKISFDPCDTDKCREIEPSETDELHFDFVIASAHKSIMAYSHVANLVKHAGSEFLLVPCKPIGWNLTTIHDRNEDPRFESTTPNTTTPTKACSEPSAGT